MTKVKIENFQAKKVKIENFELQKRYILVWDKSPRILPPSPPRISAIFGDFSPKNPQNFGCPRPRPVPEPLERCIPVPVPEIWGFSGFIPKNPQSKFPKIPVPVPVPKNRGIGLNFRGIPENPRTFEPQLISPT